jgi:hypothetical protein
MTVRQGNRRIAIRNLTTNAVYPEYEVRCDLDEGFDKTLEPLKLFTCTHIEGVMCNP